MADRPARRVPWQLYLDASLAWHGGAEGEALVLLGLLVPGDAITLGGWGRLVRRALPGMPYPPPSREYLSIELAQVVARALSPNPWVAAGAAEPDEPFEADAEDGPDADGQRVAPAAEPGVPENPGVELDRAWQRLQQVSGVAARAVRDAVAESEWPAVPDLRQASERVRIVEPALHRWLSARRERFDEGLDDLLQLISMVPRAQCIALRAPADEARRLGAAGLPGLLGELLDALLDEVEQRVAWTLHTPADVYVRASLRGHRLVSARPARLPDPGPRPLASGVHFLLVDGDCHAPVLSRHPGLVLVDALAPKARHDRAAHLAPVAVGRLARVQGGAGPLGVVLDVIFDSGDPARLAIGRSLGRGPRWRAVVHEILS